ncbi:hypothetical protein CJD36_008005 [Flavipsychrobacter stenotrophus]|uniref:Uncharacterized protein n=1 Tax=Flavipsychrobacter stenotrophus TaxID=2077091 RepID=A0A2S7SXS2_9BACT|nr:hypothetical protein [Flavipsychrobacter stenotrophus]PQJ11729.1 hypothetical protein CJD36_008005 [Flavipsychrobacter stenotrophus]
MKLYINNMQMAVIDSADTRPFPYADWCTFSANGNLLYYIPARTKYTLYLNNKPINISEKPFRAMSVNNGGKYAYVKEEMDRQYLVTSDTTIGPFYKNKSAEGPYGNIQNSGNYAYTIEDSAGAYMIINGGVHRTHDGDSKLSTRGHIVCSYKDDSAYKKNTFKSKSNEVYGFRNRYSDRDLTMRNYHNTVEIDAPFLINIDGQTKYTKYNKIYALGVNDKGQIYFCGQRNYCIYRNINGKELPEPITKYGVRPHIFSMTAEGSTVHSFTTDDSEYLYHDEELLYKCARGKPGIFYVAGYNLVKRSDETPKNLYGLATDTNMYVIYNGEFSKPIGSTIAVGNLVYGTIEDPVTGEKAYTNEKEIDPQIIKSGGDGRNFFFIQKMTDNKYVILYNNKIIATLTKDELGDISSAVSNEYYIDKQQLIFYGIKNGKVCHYNAKL